MHVSKQKAYLIQVGADGVRGLDDLNMALGRGWRVVETTPLGGAAAGTEADARLCLACLVVVERSERPAASLLETSEEDEIVDELLEGDGADAEVDTDL